ncbi:MAG: sensor histidine kinase [Anaerolineae bacterium]
MGNLDEAAATADNEQRVLLAAAKALAVAEDVTAVGDALITAIAALPGPQNAQIALRSEPQVDAPLLLWTWTGSIGATVVETLQGDMCCGLGSDNVTEGWHSALGAHRPLPAPVDCEDCIEAYVAVPVDGHTWGLLSARTAVALGAHRVSLALMAYLAGAALARLWSAKECQDLRDKVATVQGIITRLDERLALTAGLASIGELVSGVAHELNNPLTSVLGYAELLLNMDVPDTFKPDLEIIRNEAARCRAIVKNLLSLARRQQPGLEPVQINDLIQRTIELKAYPLRMDNMRVEARLHPELPPVLANAHKIQQVLLNLANNAHEAMAGRQHGVISISSQVVRDDCDRMVRVTVADDGPGIPDELHERIFESFFTTKHTGTGLGLAISRKLVTECGGRLIFDDSYSGGARFMLELPIAVPARFESLHESAAAPDYALRASVLIVDDELELVELVERVLTDQGYTVAHALSGEDALRKLGERPFDLVLLDLRMPGFGGREVYRQIHVRFPKLPTRVIFTTGDVATAETSEWLAGTGCLVLEKPFDGHELLRKIQDALE